MDLKKEGEKIGAEVYERIRKEYSGLDYHDLITLIDNLYAGIFQRVYVFLHIRLYIWLVFHRILYSNPYLSLSILLYKFIK